MKILIVGGRWTMSGGRASGLVKKIGNELKKYCDVVIQNGGPVAYLSMLKYYSRNFDVVFWWPDVPDDQMFVSQNETLEQAKERCRNIKFVHPTCMLVGSKNNRSGKYSFAELITKSLVSKYNLCIEFYSSPDVIDPYDPISYNMRLFDPLGNVWYDGDNIEDMVPILYSRLETLSKITRVSTIQSQDLNWINETKEEPNELFLYLIKKYAETFHELIHPENTERMLGNCSFRCQRGFPSYRGTNCIYVSQRNVDKRYIDKDMFVPVRRNDNGQIEFCGLYKPSVDTPIQLRLYELFPKINYMIHSHCYIKDAMSTTHCIPCGGLEEVNEIVDIFQDLEDDENYTNGVQFAQINLIGHGSLVMANNVEQMSNIEYIEREIPCLIDLEQNSVLTSELIEVN